MKKFIVHYVKFTVRYDDNFIIYSNKKGSL